MKKNAKDKLIGIVSLGCDKNRVDTEIMITHLQKGGYSFTSDPSKANIIIINTCAFIEKARKEAVSTIDEMLEYKKIGDCEKVIVTGCMPQKYLPELKKDFPDVDVFIGIDNYPNIVDIVEEAYKSKKVITKIGDASSVPDAVNRVVTTPNHYAYLKIADGCNNYCTFCTIPFIRGKYRSKPMDMLLKEAKYLVKEGAKELILVAQDITKYGTDLTGKPMLVELIRNLSKLEDLKWIRLLYCYPESVSDELLEEMQNNDKLCNYLDIPLQHVSNNVLKAMNRKIDKNGIISLIEKIQKLPKKIAIRTTFMVGFPGETEEDYNELVAFIKKYKLTHVGFFEYSKEDGTVAAKMPNQVPEKVKKDRLMNIINVADKISKENRRKFIGTTLEVVYEGIDYDKELFYGRSQYQAPEVDNIVYFKSTTLVDVGSFYEVKITRTMGDDLKGERASEKFRVY
ncbi:MAG: 30S ribosomal protein S12 methylthiotransferase RimO [Clostridia bacterium]|nr:30S ribosomal protein S12 methylthiotransferase RimO [Clostridia bacterium]